MSDPNSPKPADEEPGYTQAELDGGTEDPTPVDLDDPDREELMRDRFLERPLTQDERLEIGLEMADALEEAEQLEIAKKDYDDRLKGQIAEQYEKATTLAKALHKGNREGNVPVRIVKDWKKGSVLVTRQDDGTVVEERAMTFDERQRGMFSGTIPAGPEIIGDDPDTETPPHPADAIAQTAEEQESDQVGNA